MAKFSVSCGGTGGHVFPGMATALALQKRGHAVTLWLSGKAIETATRHAWSGPVISIGAEKLSFHPLHLPRTLLSLLRVYRTSVKALREQQPDALLAMGSYSSIGPVLAARRLGIPVILHEANVIPGKAVSTFSRLATAIAISFPETRTTLKHPAMTLTGLPLRKEMEMAATLPTNTPPVFTVLTMGGSQGAQRLNETVPTALARLIAAGIPVEAIHLSGEKAKSSVEESYLAAGVPATVYGFCSDMVSVYRRTSLAISRSGANSCLELALFGIPALLVPYPHSARDHQLANARAMADAGAAEVLEQQDLSPERLAESIRFLATNPTAQSAMRRAARSRSLAGADNRLADLIEKVAASR
jgi:UDP-N-acetylglucosamine--N-acetylmuramyl-(pentapeptide) pyrophosphoryl-undecaprenol N-acetylglucosamine transferase